MRALISGLFILLCSTGASESAAQTHALVLRPSESVLNFSLYSGFIQGSGRFTKYSGSLHSSSQDFTQSVISFDMDPVVAEFEADAVLLQSVVQRLPSQPLHFKSSTLRATGPGKYRVSGTVTSRGKAKAVAFPITVKKSSKGDTIIEGNIESSELDLHFPPALQGQDMSGTLNYRLVFR